MDWQQIEAAGLRVPVPAGVAPAPGQGVEGEVAVLEGEGLRVVVDRSLFADPLTGHAQQPGYESWDEDTPDGPRTLVSFPTVDGTVVATRLPGATVTVQVGQGADPAAAVRILRGISGMP